MSGDELAGLAAGATVVEFPAGAVIADYADRVPDDVWMVYTGQVTLQASGDGATIDTVGRGGIFGYTPLLTGGGMEFDARATVPSTLIRLPGAPVRAQFARPAGLAFLASSAWNTVRRAARDRARHRQPAGRRTRARRRARGRPPPPRCATRWCR